MCIRDSRDKSFKEMTLDEWDIVINVHLNGTAYVTWHAWPFMYENNFGRIIFTSSVSGILGSFGQGNYGAAKMGMVGLMNNLSREGASHNVRVNCLSPGAATRMTASVPGSAIDADNPDPGKQDWDPQDDEGPGPDEEGQPTEQELAEKADAAAAAVSVQAPASKFMTIAEWLSAAGARLTATICSGCPLSFQLSFWPMM